MQVRSTLVALLMPFLACAANAQAPAAPKPLVTQAVNGSRVLPLHGTVHPLAQARFDRGPVSDSFATGRMLLLLNRPPGREAALQQYLKDVNTPGSASYHKWLTPQQFGAQFGPADSDVQAATAWLTSSGFTVAQVSKGRQFIVFSGTAGNVRAAFRTVIHRYSINGAIHYANASDVEIPAALAPLIKGVAPLNDFRARPQLRILGQASYSRLTHRATTQWTLPNGSDTIYALAPEDFATQYDLGPLYKAGVNGAGQTIGIINESNLDLSLVQNYQKLFGLSSPLPQVVIDGSDPGVLSNVSVEAALDVEEAGAVAPGARVDLYIANTNGIFTGDSQSTNVVDPLYMAALRAVDDNQASVLSVSFSNCEGYLLQAGNALWSALWEQAAAQGQTVLVATGDSGSAGCDDANHQWITGYGPAVNGLASTPWDVAVGGTDFYYSDYATGGASMASLWNQTNDTGLGSLKAPLPEQVWDTTFGFNAIGPYVQNMSQAIPAGGGGASSCIYNSGTSSEPYICLGVGSTGVPGYAKPRWQTGSGVPSDGVRDLPDVSLFAANGTNMSAYPVCALPGDCVPGSSGNEQITLVGGTSVSAPAMAAIMALVDQKYGRQGQADFTLYPLAQQIPSAFRDVTVGSNNMTCMDGTPYCWPDTNGDGLFSLQKYAATAGYDLASGLGSVDAAVLVNNWNSIAFQPTSTSLQVTPATAQRGAAVNFTVSVKSASGGAPPQGNLSILAQLPDAPGSQSLGSFAVNNGEATGQLADLPGGTYPVWAQYSGDGHFAASISQPQTVTITPAGSVLNLYGLMVPGKTLNPSAPCQLNPNQSVFEQSTNSGPWEPWPSGSTFDAGWQVAPVAIANGAWPSFGSGTGTVTFTLDGTPQATVALNSLGYAAWIPPSTFDAGTHTIGAIYSGDSGYAASSATPYTVVIPRTTPWLSAWPVANCDNPQASAPACTFTAGDDMYVEIQISDANCHVPTGAVTVNLGSLSQNVTLIPGGITTQSINFVGIPVLSGEAVFKNLPAGTYALSASYAGDANSLPTTSTAQINEIGQYGQSFTVVAAAPSGQPALLSSTTTVSVDPPSFNDTLWMTFDLTATVTGGAGSTTPPTGTVAFFDDGVEVAQGTLTPAGINNSTVTSIGEGLLMDAGASQLKAVYSGDSVYQSSEAGQTYQFTIPVTPDFLLSPQTPRMTLPTGGSATAALSLASVNGYNGTVSLACTPSSSAITCSMSPASLTVNGPATATLTVRAASQTASSPPPSRQAPARWPIAAGALVFGLFLAGGRKRRRFWPSTLLCLCILACGWSIGCGSGAGSTPSQPISPTAPAPPPSCTVQVTASANGIVHSAEITVVMP